MKVASYIRVLKGYKRFALYNLKYKFVVPITPLEANILDVLASGRQVRQSDFNVERDDFWSSIGNLRRTGALSAGSPQKVEIEFDEDYEEFRLSSFDQVWLEVTNSCNLSCSHCYSESSPKVDRSDELDFDSWVKIINKVGKQGVKLVTLIGGEPLVRYELVKKIIKFIKNSYPEIQVNIFTNLTMLPPYNDFLEILKENNVRVGTSLYGIESCSHDLMTERKGSWYKTTSNIKKLTSAGVAVFAGYYRSYKCNLSKVDIEKFINALGISEFEITSPSKVGRGDRTEWKITNLENNLPKRKYFNYSSPYKNMQVHNCFADTISINQAGDVIPCIMARKEKYGNLHKQELVEIFNSNVYKKYASLSKDRIEGCKDCEFRFGCFDCRPDAMNGSNELLKKPDCGYSPYDEL